MFKITDNKGFHMTFANGVTLSVQWGAGNYCDNYNVSDYKKPVQPSNTAEIMAWDKNANTLVLPGKDDPDVDGYLSTDEVAKVIAWASELKAE